MPKVSVILPIYNAEPYLHQCLESIRVQTLEDIEVLCVNDGSKDDSLATIQKFAAKDPRFKVLDKPNGGYGHSLNYGLARATGEYISIVEPDDFIDSRMYEDLYGFAQLDGMPVDIVKGSYWEYFDGRDGFPEELREPNISKFMPKTPKSFTLEENAEVFCHHPCIWSALYRKKFLDQNSIRFVEPKGAGWADNPFLAETLISAHRIVWVPKNYYFYRQTNAGASSFLKDFHVPFDRTREMRSILKEHHASDDVWAAFYLREFDYIYSVVGEFGFSEIDPEIRELIKEVLDSMDSAIVHANTRLRPKDIRYYDEFQGGNLGTVQLSGGVFAPRRPSANTPLVSYVVPVGDCGHWIAQSLESLMSSQHHEYEVICVNSGSRDRSMLICHSLADRDEHVVCLEDDYGSQFEGVNAGLAQARGTYVFVWDPSMAVDERFSIAVDSLVNSSVDVLVIDDVMRHVVDVLGLQSDYALDASEFQRSPNAVDSCVSRALRPSEISAFALNCATPNYRTYFYRRAYLQGQGLLQTSADARGNGRFGALAVLKADSIAYAAMSCFIKLDKDPAVMPFYLDLHDELQVERPLCLPGALAVCNDVSDYGQKTYARSLKNLILDSFMADLEERPSYSSLKAYVDSYFKQVDEILGPDFSGRDAYNDANFVLFQMLKQFGIAGYVSDRYFQSDIDNTWLKSDLENLYTSPTLLVGRKVNHLVRKMLPDKMLGALKSSFSE